MKLTDPYEILERTKSNFVENVRKLEPGKFKVFIQYYPRAQRIKIRIGTEGKSGEGVAVLKSGDIEMIGTLFNDLIKTKMTAKFVELDNEIRLLRSAVKFLRKEVEAIKNCPTVKKELKGE